MSGQEMCNNKMTVIFLWAKSYERPSLPHWHKRLDFIYREAKETTAVNPELYKSDGSEPFETKWITVTDKIKEDSQERGKNDRTD